MTISSQSKKWYSITAVQVVFLAIIASVVIFSNLGKSAVYDWDEAHYAENALEMIQSHNWSVIQYGGQPDMDNTKFPLGTWLIAINFKLFGYNEIALRFWPALSSLATIILTYFIGKEIKNKYFGLMAAVILLSSSQLMIWHGGRTGDFDAGLMFFTSLALFLFLLSLKKNRLKFFYIGVLVTGLSVLYKSFISLMPLAIFFLVLLTRSRDERRRYFKPAILLRTLGILIVILTPWLVVRGHGFLWRMLSYDYSQRLMTSVDGHQGPWYFYLRELSQTYFPWIYFLFFGIILSLKNIFKDKQNDYAWLLIWLGFIFILFSSAQTKVFWYVLPLFPAMALITAEFFYFLINKAQNKRERFFAWLLFLIMTAAAAFNTGVGLRATNNYDDFRTLTGDKLIKEELSQADILWIGQNINSQSHFFYLQTLLPHGRIMPVEKQACEINKDQRVLLTVQEANDYLPSCPQRKPVTQVKDWVLIR